MRNKYTKENLENAAKHCLSWRQMLLHFSLKETGGNYSSMKKRCKKFNIDVSHFTGQGWNKKGHPSFGNSGKSIKDYFTKNGEIKSSNVRERLINNGLKQNKCEKCGISEWNGEPITIQLHHINGIRSDNRLENLMMLCPNCHSQTETFCKRKTVINIKKLEKEIKSTK